MREIKFRAWDKEFSQMLYGISIGGPAIHIDSRAHRGKVGNWPERFVVGWNNKEDFEVMQYTGLKDANGKDIYEGDIVQFIDEKMKVFFNKYTACFDVEFIAGGCGECEPLVNGEWDEEDVEVIGNTYENPELLESEGVEE